LNPTDRSRWMRSYPAYKYTRCQPP